MAPGRRRGAKGVKTTTDLTLGDLVLAKVKGFPAWPAKVSRPEDWGRAPDPKKYFVQFFGTSEIAFVAPPDIQAFTIEAKNKLSARCQGKTVKYFAQAVKEISAEFEASHPKNLTGLRDEDNGKNLASETNSVDSVANETMDTHGTDDTKPSSSDDANNNLSRSPYLGKKYKLSSNPANLAESVPGSGPSSHPPDKEQTHHDRGKNGCSDAKNELTNGHQPKLAMGQRRKHVGAVRRNSGTASSQEHISDGVPTKFSPAVNVKVSSTSKVGSDVGSNGKGKKLLKQKRHSEAADNMQVDSEGINEDHKEVISRKKMKFQHDQEKHISRANDISSPAKMSKFSDTIDDVKVLRAQGSRKNDSKDHVHLEDKMSDAGSKRLKLSGKDEVQRLKTQKGIDASNDSANADDFPPLKRHRRAPDSSSSLLHDNKLESLALHKNGMSNPKKILSPVVQQPTKRRAVRICDDDDDELPKTPIHGRSTHKVSDNPPVPDSKRKNVARSESNVNDKLVLGKLGRVDNVLKEQEQPSLTSNKASTPTSQQSMEKGTRDPSVSVQQASPSPTLTGLEGKTLKDTRSIIASPKGSPGPINATRPLAELQKKHVVKGHSSNSQKKAVSVGDRGLTTTSKKSELSLNQSISERNKLTSAEKKKIATKTDSQVSLVVDNPDESTSPVERLNIGKDLESSLQVNMKITDSVVSMRHLIAAAQARKKQANLDHLRGNSVSVSVTDVDVLRQSPSLAPTSLEVESSNKLQRDSQGIHSNSPPDVHQFSSVNEHENGELEERRLSSSHQASGSSLSGGTEAAVARDAFEGMIETLSRTKESIGRATRLAIDCAKYGIANEIVELLVRKLENESSLHRKVDLFFLVDSITQCSHGQKGVAGAAYIPTVQAALPRLIGAAAPPGQGALENRRQCHKVLRLWVERKILPESVLRRFMDDMGAKNDDTSSGLSLRRPSRAERAIDDPIREMEGMLVDEYGSNATFQLPGFLARHVFEEEEDEDNFPSNFSKEVAETSLSKHTPSSDPESSSVTPVDGRHCILEDVDGELEMEDVSGNQKVENPVPAWSTREVASIDPMSTVVFESALATSELLPSPEGTPPLPPGSPPLTPPLPTSPPPSSPPPLPPPPSTPPPPLPPSSPPPPPPPPSSEQPLIPLPPVGPPQLISNQSLPSQSTLMSQCVPPHPPAVSSSQPFAYCPPSLPHEVGGATSGNQDANTVSNIDSPANGEVFPQQKSFYSSAAVNNVRENAGYNSTRLLEHGQGDAYITSQTSQHRQSYVPGSSETFAQRPLNLEPPPLRTTSHFSYPNSVQQHQYPPYSLGNFADGPRRYVGVNTGYFGTPERPSISSINFQPSAANSVPAATPIPGDVSGNGVPMMPFKPDISSINWRPAMHE